jgi:hypothetical protein
MIIFFSGSHFSNKASVQSNVIYGNDLSLHGGVLVDFCKIGQRLIYFSFFEHKNRFKKVRLIF